MSKHKHLTAQVQGLIEFNEERFDLSSPEKAEAARKAAPIAARLVSEHLARIAKAVQADVEQHHKATLQHLLQDVGEAAREADEKEAA